MERIIDYVRWYSDIPFAGHAGQAETAHAVACLVAHSQVGEEFIAISVGYSLLDGCAVEWLMGEHGAGTDIAGFCTDTVGCGHTGTGIAFRRAERAARLKVAFSIKQQRTGGGQSAGICTCRKGTGKDILQLPGEAAVCNQAVENPDHIPKAALW